MGQSNRPPSTLYRGHSSRAHNPRIEPDENDTRTTTEHFKLEGTEMKTDYCRRPYHYEHELPRTITHRVHVLVDLRRPRVAISARHAGRSAPNSGRKGATPSAPAIPVNGRRGATKSTQTPARKRTNKKRNDETDDEDEDMLKLEKETKIKRSPPCDRWTVFSQGPDHTIQNQYHERQDQLVHVMEQRAHRAPAASATSRPKSAILDTDLRLDFSYLVPLWGRCEDSRLLVSAVGGQRPGRDAQPHPGRVQERGAEGETGQLHPGAESLIIRFTS
ncbi:hypothetical protein PG991_013077 [Apiospora marii]|uniref:Uncharacterized protein n=1 Tax=Apiospora marii TaxID=335849 RepID=A0ABR1R5W3_9PEZI